MPQNAHQYRVSACDLLVKASAAPNPTLRDAWIALAVRFQGLAREAEAQETWALPDHPTRP
jgi:hypothetical protein